MRGGGRSTITGDRTLPIGWPTFEHYLDSLWAGYRRQVADSVRTAHEAGLTLRTVHDIGPECERVFRLYEQVMDRAEYRLERLSLESFRCPNRSLRPQSRVLLVERDGQLAAAAVLLDAPRATTSLLAGIDYTCHRDSCAYPCPVTEIVREAILRGFRSVELGQTSYALKGRLGALSAPRWFCIRHAGALQNTLPRGASDVLFPRTSVPARRVLRADTTHHPTAAAAAGFAGGL